MSLHNGIDTVAWVSLGLYTKTYGATDQININSLFTSLGLLETAPEAAIASYVNMFPGDIHGQPSRSMSGAVVIGPRRDIIY